MVTNDCSQHNCLFSHQEMKSTAFPPSLGWPCNFHDIDCGRISTVLVLGLAPRALVSFALTLLESIQHATEQRSHLERPEVLFLGLGCREVLQVPRVYKLLAIPRKAEKLSSQNPKSCEH